MSTSGSPAAGAEGPAGPGGADPGADLCPSHPGGDVVIVPIDNTPGSEEAFTWYVAHLHRPKNSVILVHAQDAPTMPTRDLIIIRPDLFCGRNSMYDKFDAWESKISGSSIAKRQEIVDKYNAKFKELGLQGRCVVDVEKPGPLVIDVAKQEGADYIVMGRRVQGVLRRTLMGSVSDYVVHHAQCPVIVCRH